MTITRRGLLASAAGSILLASCATVKLAPAGMYRVGNAFSITLTRPWSDLTAAAMQPPGVRVLTIDGRGLNQLFAADVAPAGSLVRTADKDTPKPTYRADMSDTEVVEFVVDSLAAMGFLEPTSAGLRPQSFVGASGVRFDISSRSETGLNYSGTAIAARAGERLHLLIFLAPTEHYYSTFASEIEAVFASATAA
ncbi:MAG: hypothetical protein ABL883_08655 [Terricaulis sp.]